MSPAIITPLSKSDYLQRFNKHDSVSDSIFLLQLMTPNRSLPHRAVVILHYQNKWIVQWCEQVPASPGRMMQPASAALAPAQFWLHDSPWATSEPFTKIITAFCNGTPEDVIWQIH